MSKVMQREYEKHGFFRFISDCKELKNLKLGENGINTICRVLGVSKRQIKMKGERERITFSGIIADYTAKFLLVSWEEREEIKKGKVLRIENGNVRKWRGMPALYIDRDTKLSKVEVDFPPLSELTKPKKRSIGEIISCQGAFDVIVEADVVSVSQQEKRRIIVDDGTGALFLLFKEKKEEKGKHFRMGMSVRARGGVIEKDRGYVLIAEELQILDEGFIWEEIKNFLCRYT